MNTQVVCLLILVMTTLGCRREDPNPEVSDRIYQDLISEVRSYEQLQEESLKAVEAAEKDLANSTARTIDRKNAQRDLVRTKERLVKTTEMLEYYKIRAERRRVEGRRAYKMAFRSGKEWPDKAEYESYQVNKRLSRASRNWNDRVPRSQSQKAKTEKKPSPEEKTE